MIEPLSSLVGATDGITNIAERLGFLDKVKRKLVSQPDPALAKLETVLIEISKIYGLLDNTVNEYLGLWLLPDDENQRLREEIATLRRLAAGSHEASMHKAKGDCNKIWSIYKAYLRPWFKRVLNTKEHEHLGCLFRRMMAFDSVMVNTIEATAAWLTVHASKTLVLVEAKDYTAADRSIQEAWHHWQPAAAALRESMKTLYDLRAYFIKVSGAV